MLSTIENASDVCVCVCVCECLVFHTFRSVLKKYFLNSNLKVNHNSTVPKIKFPSVISINYIQ